MLTAQQQREIAQLLEVADMHFEFDRLIYPDFSNAAYAYDQVLTLDPCEQRANTGLQNVVDRLASRISNELTSGEKTQASLLSEVEAGLSWAPRHPELLALRQQLSGNP